MPILKFSIITVSYNQGKFIQDNILSVINQHYPAVEHIIVDAGSTDNTINILHKYSKYLIWISEPDKGQSDGLNKGLRLATGDIIGWFNSDDRIPPDALRKVSQFFLDNPEEIAVVGDQAIIDLNGLTQRIIKSREYTADYLINYARGITQNSMFFKREVLNKIGYLNESYHYAMDRDLFIRLAKIRKIRYLDEILGEFRIQPDAKTSKGSYPFVKELIKIRILNGGSWLSPGLINDFYYILTEPLRKIKWIRITIRHIKGINK